jgi:RHS repeat-associated protein
MDFVWRLADVTRSVRSISYTRTDGPNKESFSSRFCSAKSALRHLGIGLLLLLSVFISIKSTTARAGTAPRPSPPVYTCGGGICSNFQSPLTVECPDGPISALRSCSEANYNNYLSQYFGTLTYLYQMNYSGGGVYLWWSSQGNGNYASPLGLVSSGTDVPSFERNLGNKGCGSCGGPMQGNPVNISFGNKFEDETDYEGTGSFSLTFHRYYNSASFGGDGTIGVQWTHTFSRSLTLQSPTEAKLFRDDGEILYFNQCGSLWCATPDEKGSLLQISDGSVNITGWQFTDENHITEIYNADGTLQSETDNAGISHVLAYDATDRLSKITDSFGRELLLTYNTSNQLSQIQAPDGGLFVYNYDTSGNLSTVNYPGNKTRTYFYNEAANVASGAGPNLLTGVQDEAGQRFATFQYDGQSRAVVSEHAGGAGFIQLTYNSDGSTGLVDALGDSRTYGFQTIQNVNHITALNGVACTSCGLIASYAYNPAGDFTSTTDFKGVQTTYSIDSAHLEEVRVEASGLATQRTTNTQWNTALRAPLTRTVSDANNKLVSSKGWVYNAAGEVLAYCEIDPTNSAAASYTCSAIGTVPTGVRRWTYTYCTAVNTTQCPIVGLLLSVTGPRTDLTQTTTYSYYTTSSATNCGMTGAVCYQPGDLKSITDPLGHVTTYLNYDGAGRVLAMEDVNGVYTDMTYTPRGWLSTRTIRVTPDNSAGSSDATTTLAYTNYGAVNSITDADDVVTTFKYDPAHRLTDIVDALGKSIHYTLDAAGNKLTVQNLTASGTVARSTTNQYNALGQLTQVIDGLNKAVFSAAYSDSYDADGNLTHSSDGLSVQRQLAYDPLNRLQKTIDNYNGTDTATQNTTTTVQQDALDRVSSVTDPTNLTTTYGFDGLSNRTSLQSPDTGSSSDKFDAAGNRLTHTDAKGVVSTSTFDALNRVTATSYSTDSSLNVSYYYDEANSVTGCANSRPLGRLTRMVENSVTTYYCYGGHGNMGPKRQVFAGHTDITQYAFTPANRLSGITMPDGAVVSYSHNPDGYVSGATVTPSGSSSASTIVSATTYYSFGPLGSYTLGNGQMVTYTYDANYRLTDATSPVLALHFARDVMGNINALGTAAGANPATESYHYDPLYRLKDATEANGTVQESYTYNQTGDRLSKTAPGLATGAYLYTAGTHQLHSVGNALRANDLNGNTTGDIIGGNTYGFGYNARNRLSLAQLNGSTVATYTYNAMGQRIGKTLAPSSTVSERYAYDENNHLIAEYGTTNRDYIWLGDTPVAVIDNTLNGSVTTNVINYVHADGLNTPRVVTNSSGTVIWQWAYQSNPFGEQKPTSTTGYVLNLRYPGQYFDVETGLVYNGARYFESATGRFLQPDPSGFLGGIGLYVYGLNNPLMYIDPTGLSPPGAPPPMGPFSPEGPPQIPGADDIPSAIPGGPWAPAGPGQPLGRFFGPKQTRGPKAECQWVPREGDGGPPGSVGYWKGKEPGQDWTRYDQGGNVQTPEQAHPNPLPAEPTAEPPPSVETPTVTEPTVVEPPIIEGPIIEGPIIW